MIRELIFAKINLWAGATPAIARLSHCSGVAGGVELVYTMKFYYTYVLLSKKDNKLYIGYTDNLIQRVNKHKIGKVDSTKDRRPLKLVYYEACRNENKAIKREKYFKTGFGRRFLKSRI